MLPPENPRLVAATHANRLMAVMDRNVERVDEAVDRVIKELNECPETDVASYVRELQPNLRIAHRDMPDMPRAHLDAYLVDLTARPPQLGAWQRLGSDKIAGALTGFLDTLSRAHAAADLWRVYQMHTTTW